MASWIDSLIPSAGVDTNKQSPYMGQFGQQAWGTIGGLDQYNLGGQNLGQYQNLTQQGVNNPYAGGYQQGAGQAGQMGMQAGAGTYGLGGQVQGMGQNLMPDVQSLIAMGFDPQNALYARTQQQVADQSNAQAAASGVGGTPYGQGVAGQTMSNFNIDWQNQQLQRAATGAGAAGQLGGAATGMIGQGAQLQSAGIGQFMQGAGQPYNTYAGINQNQLGLLNQANQYGQGAAAIPQMQAQDYMQFLQGQSQFQGQQTGQQLQQAQQEFQQAQAIGQDIGSAVGGGFGMGGFGGGMGGMGGGGAGFGGFGSMFGGGGGGGYGGSPFGGGWGAFNGGGFGGYGGNFQGYQPSAPRMPGYTGAY